MNRIQVHRRRFGLKFGNTFIGVTEWLPWRERERKRLAFVIPRVEDRKQIRALILKKMGASMEVDA